MQPQFYSFRWLTLLLSQEFALPGKCSLTKSQTLISLVIHELCKKCMGVLYRPLKQQTNKQRATTTTTTTTTTKHKRSETYPKIQGA